MYAYEKIKLFERCTQFIAMMLMIILRFRLQSIEVLNT